MPNTLVKARRRAQMACVTRKSHPTNGYAMKPEVARVIEAVCGGLPAGQNQVWVRPYKIYHRVPVMAAGNILTLDFFNARRQKGVSNLDTPNSLPANYGFALTSLRFDFLPGFDELGYRLGVRTAAPTTAQYQASALNFGSAGAVITDALAQMWKWQEKIRELMNQGVITLTIAEKPVFEIFGVTSFPAGKGLNVNAVHQTSMTNAASAASIQDSMNNITNGVPVISNRFDFGSPYPIMAGQQFGVKVELQQKLDWTETNLGPLNSIATTGSVAAELTAGTLTCEMEGLLASPAN
jgi:hypothetical protein